MVSAITPLWGILFLVAFNLQVAAACRPGTCDQPTNPTAVPAMKPKADIASLMDSWLAAKMRL